MPISHAQVLRHVVEEAVLADRIGLACFGVGEHHRADFAISAPEVLLAAIASRTDGRSEKPIAVHSPGHVAATDDEAREQLWPHYRDIMTRIGSERGWPPVTRAHFDREAGPDGALYVGAPETVAQKIAATVRTLGLSRFDLKYSNGRLPHEACLRSIELYGTVVAPRVRALLRG